MVFTTKKIHLYCYRWIFQSIVFAYTVYRLMYQNKVAILQEGFEGSNYII